MSFPESQRVLYGITPLLQVICQVRFPTILEIEAAPPATYQERIRAEYPKYERHDSTPKDAALLAQQLGIQPPPAKIVHMFKTENSEREIHLTNETLALIDSSYTRWEDFSRSFEDAELALDEVYRPSYYSRIGLRYTNLVYREDLGLAETDWSELINPELAGIFGDAAIGPNIEEFVGNTLISLGDGNRVHIRHGLGRHAEKEEFGYMVDADFFTTTTEGRSHVAERLADFNRRAGRLFRWAIRDTLHDALKPQAI